MIFWFLPSFHWNNNYMPLSWCVGLCLLAFVYAGYVKEKLGWIFAVSILYVLLQSLYVCAFQWNRYFAMGQYFTNIQTGSLFTSIIFIALTFLSTRMKKYSVYLMRWAPWFGVANAIYVIIGAIFGFGRLPMGVGYSGVIDYSGMNAVLMAMSVPFLLDESICGSVYGSMGIILVFSAIVLSKASVPYGVLAIVFGSYFLHRYKKIGAFIFCIVSTLFVAWLFRGRFMVDDAYRFAAYKLFMGAWKNSGPWVWAFGSGTGTYQSLAPLIQIQNKFMVNQGPLHQDAYIWLWMHSDWLQNLFEYGIIGSALFISCYFQVIVKLFRKELSSIFSLAMALGASAVFDYPLRHFQTALFIVLAVGVAVE